MIKDAYFIEGEADMQKLIGTVARFAITAGEPVTQGALVAPGDRGFLAAALTPGMRAITVTISAQSGVAGFIFRRNIITVFMSIELMLNAVNLSFVAFSYQLKQVDGHIFTFFVMMVAAAKAAMGLAIILTVFKNRGTLNIDDVSSLKY